jgi:hypothetical protein
MALTHRSNALAGHAWGFGTPGPVPSPRLRSSSRRGLIPGRPRWANKGAVMSNSRARAGTDDPTEAQRAALPIAFYIGKDQVPQYLRWLFAK